MSGRVFFCLHEAYFLFSTCIPLMASLRKFLVFFCVTDLREISEWEHFVLLSLSLSVTHTYTHTCAHLGELFYEI